MAGQLYGTFKEGKPLFNMPLPDLPVRVPADVLKWRIRCRKKCLAVVFLKRASSITEHYLFQKDGQLVPGPMIGENRHAKAGG